MEYYTFEQLRPMALQAGISDNKVSIGSYLRFKGYIKKRKQINKVVTIYYCKPDQH